MPSLMIAEKYGSFFQLARQHQVIFYYVGYFSQHIVAAMAEAVKLQLEVAGVAAPTRRKLFSSFVEMAQNIIHYSADSLTPPSQNNGELRHGSVCIRVAKRSCRHRTAAWCRVCNTGSSSNAARTGPEFSAEMLRSLTSAKFRSTQ